MAPWMLLAVSKLRIGAGVSTAASAATVFSSGFAAFMTALCCIISQIESSSSPLSPARAAGAKAADRPNAAADERSLRRVSLIGSPVRTKTSADQIDGLKIPFARGTPQHTEL